MSPTQKITTVGVVSLIGGLLFLLGWSSASEAVKSEPPAANARIARTALSIDDHRAQELKLSDGNRLSFGDDGRTLTIIDTASGRRMRNYRLKHERFHPSLSMLPSGRILIWGGMNQDQRIFGDGVWFDPETGQLTVASGLGLTPRAGHSATVLTDGSLLLAGGLTRGARATPTTETWSEQTGAVSRLGTAFDVGRHGHRAMLADDGGILVQGGIGHDGKSVVATHLQVGNSTSPTATGPAQAAAFALAGASPGRGSRQVQPSQWLGLRFNQPLDASKLVNGSIALIGPNGITTIDTTIAEGGKLMFVRPQFPLLPESKYTLALNRLRSQSGQSLALTTVEFETAALHAQAGVDEAKTPKLLRYPTGCGPATKPLPCNAQGRVEDGVWTPGQDNTDGRWRLYTQKYQIKPDTALQRSMTTASRRALTGRIAQIDEKPVAGVSVEIDGKAVITNRDGIFVLYDVPHGRREVFVDGSTANRGGAEYGQFVVGVDIARNGLTQLPYTMYLPRIAARDKIKIRSPLAKDTVVTHPAMPGLEVTIPAGTIVRDRKGKLVTEIALVPTPVNRAPFPVTENFPMYFTFEPGGAVIQGLDPKAANGIRVSYPNYDGNPKSTQSRFWAYDPGKGWQVYGKGSLTADNSRFVAQNGIALHRMTGGAYTVNDDDPPTEPDLPEDGDECGCGGSGGVANAGDPIDLKTGYFTHTKTDITIRDLMPITLSRHYRTHDSRKRMFGIGTTSNYGYTLYTTLSDSYDTIRLVQPNGSGLNFDRIGPRPTNYSISSWRHSDSTGDFAGAVLQTVVNDPVDGEGYRLTKVDGTIMYFESASYSGDGSSRLRYIRNRYGRQMNFVYDAGLLTQIISPSGRYLDLVYDTENRLSTATDHTGRTWTYSYSPEGMLTRITYPDTTHEDIAYDTNLITITTPSFLIHRLKSITNRRGHVELLNTYESATLDVGIATAYRVVKQTRADTGEINIQYGHFNGSNYGVLVTEPDESQRRVVFGSWRYPISDTLAYGTLIAQTYTFERDPITQRMTARIDDLGRRTEYQYDANGMQTQVRAMVGTANASTVSFTYDTFGVLTSTTDPLNQPTVYENDNGCLKRVTDPLNHTKTYECNGDGLTISATNALGKTSYFFYNNGEMIASVDEMNRATGYAYDSLGRIVVIRDPQGRIHRTEYDTNDRVNKEIDPTGKETVYAYDGNGNMTAVLKSHGNGLTYTYDVRNRMTSRTDSLSQIESWTYDTMDRISSHTSRMSQVIQYGYDVLGRLKTTTYHDNALVTRGYDAGNRLRTLADTANGTLTWDYDDFDRATLVSAPQGNINYGYDAAGRRTSMTPAAQAQITYQYDAAGRLTRIQQGSEIVDHAYDDHDRITQLTLPNGVKTGYAYNDANQLTGIAYLKADNTTLGNLGYGYDSTGKQVAQTGSFASNLLPPATTANGTFDDNHRQTSWNGQAIAYDANGNMLSDGTRTYHWDVRDQLVEIKQGGSTIATFTYDALGRRVGRTEAGAATSYLYDGPNAVQETQGAIVNPVLTGLGIDERIARNDAGGRSYFLRDILGSTRALTSNTGNVVQRYDYSPYGDSTQTSPSFSNPYLFTGRERDASGLYYYRARYYSVDMGRFVSEDPIGLLGGLNTYAYVGGNPVSYVDPTGEIAFVPILIGIGVGYAFDYALEQYKKANCTCQDTPAGSAGNAAAGGAVGGAGPFASKPRGGIAGGGPSGTGTSSFSQMNHAAASRGWYSVATRNGITKGLRKVPYAGAALGGYEIYNALSCD